MKKKERKEKENPSILPNRLGRLSANDGRILFRSFFFPFDAGKKKLVSVAGQSKRGGDPTPIFRWGGFYPFEKKNEKNKVERWA